ncbi:MAG TPA: FAD-binding oxidoreductase [Rhodopila sp.]|uniref:NAD(P)/FAD-dependent oxidoreductase n=1 Tax=Rhodopila sp. TaxID=2480087 RepID=UPI002C2DE19C|nr:FAD-binding oxidoreductase [Rhodopila sp.]HVY14472.1 FAD-binding oxidoreductase [Rhodopila sp.]
MGLLFQPYGRLPGKKVVANHFAPRFTITMHPLPRSLYADTARPAHPTPPLDGDRHTSVVIIGAGFTGLSTALHLAEKRVDTVVLEANQPGWGASGRNGGQVNPGLKHDPDTVLKDFGTDLGGRMVTLSSEAPNLVFRLVERHQIACDALQSGTLRSAITARGAQEVAALAEQWIRRDAPVSVLDQTAISAATGTRRYHAAMLDKRGGQVNPLGYARGLAQAAAQAGAVIHGDTKVIALRKLGPLWRVETQTGTVTAEKLVLATNGYTDDLWPGLRRSLVPLYSAIAATEPLPRELVDRLMPIRSSLYEIGSITVYYRFSLDNRLLIGGRSVQRDVSAPDALRYLTNYAVRLWPELQRFKWTHGWSGQLAYTPDHYPHIHEPDPAVLVCLGYNGRGVAMSTAMGPQLADRVLGGEIDMPVTAISKVPFHGLWRSGVAARVAYGRIRDMLGL